MFFFLLSSMEAIGFDRIRLTSIRCSFFFFALFLCVSSAIRRNWSYARCYACGYIKYYFLLHPWLLPPFSFIFFFIFSFFFSSSHFFWLFLVSSIFSRLGSNDEHRTNTIPYASHVECLSAFCLCSLRRVQFLKSSAIDLVGVSNNWSTSIPVYSTSFYLPSLYWSYFCVIVSKFHLSPY